MANEEDYFIAANSVGAINEEQYKKLDVLIHTTEAISRSLYQSVYLIDYYKKDSCMYQRILYFFADILQKK